MTGHLEQRIKNARTTLEGERKQVTILFADVVGSTAMIRDVDPERAADLLDPALAAMTLAVRAHGGLVARIQGDGVMALFGAPTAQEDHAIRACEAALELRNALAARKIPARVGLNSGEVVLRAVRNDLVVDYDAVGATVHLAARMERHATPGTVCISAPTAALVHGSFVVRSLGAASIKGLGRDTEVFQLLERIQDSSRWRARATRGLGPFVGRERELRILRDTALRTHAGDGGAVVITGPAGAGKSRLVHEALCRTGAAGWQRLEAAAGSEDTHASFRPLAGMLRRWLGVTTDYAQEAISRALGRAIASLGADADALFDPLISVLDVPLASAAWRGFGPGRRRRAIVQAFCSLVQLCAERQPLLLLFDDVHWFDGESRAVLAALAERPPATRALLIVTGRSDLADAWAPVSATRIALGPLDGEETRRLADALLGPTSDLADLKDQLCRRALGIPLFLEEMARSLADNGVLEGQVGAYRLGRSLETVRVPATVQAVLSERMDSIPSARKRLLQLIAAVGQTTPLRLLAAVRGWQDAALHDEIAALQAADFIMTGDESGEPVVAFRHPLTQAAAYETLLQAPRQAIHAAIADAIEAVFVHRLDEHVESLAHHSFAGASWERAAHYLHRAALRAIDRSIYQEAARRIEQALDALSRMAERPRARVEKEIDLRLTRRVALNALGRYREVLGDLDAAERLAEDIGDTARLLSVQVSRLHLFNVFGNVERAIHSGGHVANLAREQQDLNHIVAAGFFLSQAYTWHGECRSAIETASETLFHVRSREEADRFGMTGTPSVLLQAQLAFNHASLGEFARGIRHGRRAWQTAGRLRRDFDRCIAAYGYGSALFHAGLIAQALPVLEAGLRAGEASEIAIISTSTASLLAHARLLLDDPGAALAVSERALVGLDLISYPLCFALFHRALVLNETGSHADAARLARRGLRLARKNQYLGLQAWTMWLTGRISLAEDADAVRAFADAARLARKLALRPLLARCESDLAEAAAKIGRTSQAARASERAGELYRALRPRGFNSDTRRLTAVTVMARPQR